jgi:hypothetical protein
MASRLGLILALFPFIFVSNAVAVKPAAQAPLLGADRNDTTISTKLFAELEELSRIVDIAYCVGTAGLGIQKPFKCISRCSDFENFELVTVSQHTVQLLRQGVPIMTFADFHRLGIPVLSSRTPVVTLRSPILLLLHGSFLPFVGLTPLQTPL